MIQNAIIGCLTWKDLGYHFENSCTGHQDKDWGELFNRGIDGWYWSTTQNGLENAWSMGFWNGYCAMRGDQYKASGFSANCIKNMPVK